MLCSGGDPLVQIGNITLHIDVSGVDLMQKLREHAHAPAASAAAAPALASRKLLAAGAPAESNGDDTVEIEDIELFVEVNNVDLSQRKDLLAKAQNEKPATSGRRLSSSRTVSGSRTLQGSDVVEIDGVKLHVKVNGMDMTGQRATAPAPVPARRLLLAALLAPAPAPEPEEPAEEEAAAPALAPAPDTGAGEEAAEAAPAQAPAASPL